MLTHSRRIALYALSALLFAFTAVSAHAQKPVLTKSIDEPGRSPYSFTTTAKCQANLCVYSFSPVPPSFRLVVTHVSLIFAPADTSLTVAYLQQSPAQTSYEILPVGIPAGSGYVISSNPITYYVEPQGIPQISVTNGTYFGYGTITGYLVAIP